MLSWAKALKTHFAIELMKISDKTKVIYMRKTMNNNKDIILKELKVERENTLIELKKFIESRDIFKASKNSAYLIKTLSDRNYDLSKKIHHLESDFYDKKGVFITDVYLTHYELYIVKYRSLEQLKEDIKEAEINIENCNGYWKLKKEIAENQLLKIN